MVILQTNRFFKYRFNLEISYKNGYAQKAFPVNCNMYGYCNMSRARGVMHSCVITRRAAMHIRSGRPPFLV